MDLDEARHILGVAHDATAEAARRAYLRACKRHRPETDPEGFQRVRAAYDLLSSGTHAEVWVAPAKAPIDPARPPIEPHHEPPRDVPLADVPGDDPATLEARARSLFDALAREPGLTLRWSAWAAVAQHLDPCLTPITDAALAAFAETLATRLAPPSDGDAAVSPRLPEPRDASACLDVLTELALALQARGDTASASRLIDIGTGFDQERGLPSRLLPRWGVAREIDAVACALSRPVAVLLAKTFVFDAPLIAEHVLELLPPPTQWSLDQLQQRAPSLAGHLHMYVPRPAPPAPVSWSGIVAMLIVVGSILYFALARTEGPAPTNDADLLLQWNRTACDISAASCAEFRTFDLALRIRDCPVARPAFSRWLRAAKLLTQAPAVERLRAKLEQRCPEDAP